MQITAPASRTRAQLWTILRLGAAIAIAGILAWQLWRDWPTVAALQLRLEAGDLVAALVTGVAGLLCLPAAFALTLRRAGLYRRTWRWFYGRIWLQAYLYRYVPGKVVLLAERVRLGTVAGIGAGGSVLLVAWETLLLLVGAGVVLLGLLGFSATAESRQGWLVVAALVAFAALLAFPVALRALVRLVPRLAGILELRLARRDQLLLICVYSIAWLLLGASFFFACRFFVDLPLSSLPLVEFWFIGGYVAGLTAAVAPAGLGVREGVVAAGLAGTIGGGEAVAVAIAGRLWMTAIELVCIAAARAIPIPSEEHP